jgi:hypothetical protein
VLPFVIIIGVLGICLVTLSTVNNSP